MNLQKEFSISVESLFYNIKLLNKFDKDDVILIGKLHANTMFFKKLKTGLNNVSL